MAGGRGRDYIMNHKRSNACKDLGDLEGSIVVNEGFKRTYLLNQANPSSRETYVQGLSCSMLCVRGLTRLFMAG